MVFCDNQYHSYKVNEIIPLNYSMIPQNIINYFSTKYSANLYLYNYYINNKVIYILSWRNKNFYNKITYYQYTPQILDNILFQNDYIDIHASDIFILPLYHHLILIKYINTDKDYMGNSFSFSFSFDFNYYDEDVYYLGLYFNYHLYITNIYWDQNKKFYSSNIQSDHRIQYDLHLDQQYINLKIDELNTLIQANALLKNL